MIPQSMPMAEITEVAPYKVFNPWSDQQVQERELALFFLDIRDFTPLVASRPPMEVMHLLQQLFRIFQEGIGKNGGTIVETAGDGLYAVFGLDSSLQQATVAAVQAGRDILARLAKANQTWFEPFFHHQFQVGIGLHVGTVVVGHLGLGVNNSQTVMGYSVNIAARLQEATKRLNNSFVISHQAYSLLPIPPIGTSEWITLKGVKGEMKVHLLGNGYHSFPNETVCKLAS